MSQYRTAALGRTVIVPAAADLANNAIEAPATIVRIFGHSTDEHGIVSETVNLKVISDGPVELEWRTSCRLFQSEADARAATNIFPGACVAWWPNIT